MPLDQQYRDDIRCRIGWKATNPLTLHEVMAQLDRQLAEGAWRYGVVVDLRMSILAPADRDALIARILALSGTHGAHGPVALVTNQPAGVANAQVFALRSKAANSVEVFWDIDEAQRWLDEISN
jgi:hypothetical protein